MSKIILKTASGESSIYVPGNLETLNTMIPQGSALILADANVLKFHAGRIGQFPVISIPSGEKSKSMESYASVFQQMMDMNVDRSWFLVGVGGGITTDLAGFVASTYFRGIRFGFVSTTLLGQVDASIGGKNGINFKGYKNLIGVIRQPDFVLCDTTLLKTLPKKEFIGGFAEIIKYAFIYRKDLYPYLVEHLSGALEFDDEILKYLVKESVLTKVNIVSGDEFETGDRKLLNFGHTFGHALEKLYGISHGEAVAIG
ncbi:MAG: 3-dehydroquinate synthase, partial [Bacteroidales bacterium]|nr:3-dehydroquinate synthase [Bacteroidales bacterium]